MVLSIAAGAQQNSDNSARKRTIYHANVVYAFSKAKIYAGYLRSKDDTGFVDSLLAQQTIPVAKGTGRIDDGPFAGVSWQVSAPLTLTGAFYYDHMRNAMTTNGTLASGNRYAIVGIAEYALSKRTEVYGTVDFNKTRRGERRAAGSQQPDRHRDRPAQYLLTNVGTHRPAVVRPASKGRREALSSRDLHTRTRLFGECFITRPPRRKGFVGNQNMLLQCARSLSATLRASPVACRLRARASFGCARRVRPAVRNLCIR